MTKEQKALEELRDMYQTAYNIANWERCEAIETAIEALEKQIPKKPIAEVITTARTRQGEEDTITFYK